MQPKYAAARGSVGSGHCFEMFTKQKHAATYFWWVKAASRRHRIEWNWIAFGTEAQSRTVSLLLLSSTFRAALLFRLVMMTMRMESRGRDRTYTNLQYARVPPMITIWPRLCFIVAVRIPLHVKLVEMESPLANGCRITDRMTVAPQKMYSSCTNICHQPHRKKKMKSANWASMRACGALRTNHSVLAESNACVCDWLGIFLVAKQKNPNDYINDSACTSDAMDSVTDDIGRLSPACKRTNEQKLNFMCCNWNCRKL